MSIIRPVATSIVLVLLWSGRTLLGQESATVPTSAAAAIQAPDWDRAIGSFAEEVAAQVAEDGIGGIAAGVVVDGDLVWAQGFGWSDREGQIPLAPSAVSRTGSISKTVTAMLLMRLVDRGVLNLDDPVEDYLPEFSAVKSPPVGGPTVTLRHLASHTAGLEREPSNLAEMTSGPIEKWEERVAESLRNTSYDSVPGARYQYSNIGFGALGLALSRAAGVPFAELVQTEVFDPLGMTGSSFVVFGGELEPRLATGYVNGRDGTIDVGTPWQEHEGRGYKVPNGGSVAGYTAYMAVDPESTIGVVLLRNYQRGETNLGQAARALLVELAGLAGQTL